MSWVLICQLFQAAVSEVPACLDRLRGSIGKKGPLCSIACRARHLPGTSEVSRFRKISSGDACSVTPPELRCPTILIAILSSQVHTSLKAIRNLRHARSWILIPSRSMASAYRRRSSASGASRCRPCLVHPSQTRIAFLRPARGGLVTRAKLPGRWRRKLCRTPKKARPFRGGQSFAS